MSLSISFSFFSGGNNCKICVASALSLRISKSSFLLTASRASLSRYDLKTVSTTGRLEQGQQSVSKCPAAHLEYNTAASRHPRPTRSSLLGLSPSSNRTRAAFWSDSFVNIDQLANY